MRLFLALFAMSLSVISALPVEMVPTAEDPAMQIPDNADPAPPQNSEQVLVLTAEEMLVGKQVSDLQANQTEAEDEKYAKWSGWLNTWGGQVKYCTACKGIAFRGMYSYHWNVKEDRRWQYYAATYPTGMLLAGSTNEWWSKATALLKPFNVYRGDAVIVAGASNFYTSSKDRVFYFKFRKINTQAWYRKTWKWTGYNAYDKVQSGYCGSTGWMMGVASLYDSRYKDRRFNVLCGTVDKKAVVTPAWVTSTHAVAKSTTVTTSVSVTRKK